MRGWVLRFLEHDQHLRARSRSLTGSPANWINEDVLPVPRNIYGRPRSRPSTSASSTLSRDGSPVIVLRTSRFFPEPDDRKETRDTYEAMNAKVNEFLYRRVDIEDVALAVAQSIERGPVDWVSVVT